MYVLGSLFSLDIVDEEAMMASSRPSPVRSRTTQAASSTVPLVLPSDGTICNSFLNCFRSKTSLLCPRYNLAVGVPIEVTAATILLTFWDTNIKHIPVYTAVLIVSFFSIRWA